MIKTVTQAILSGLMIYPVKSLAGIELRQSEVDRFGLRHDRRWMVVNAAGKFLSQRELPQMALIRQTLSADGLTLSTNGKPDLHLPLTPREIDRIEVDVWHDHCHAIPCGSEADTWLSEALGQPCRLVYFPDGEERPIDPEYAESQDRTAFSDGFPLLLISEASLEDLNARLEQKLPISRFRPNLIVSGCNAYAEDNWRQIRIGELDCRVVKPCSRCTITTVDPKTAQRGPEPLKTLAGYRRQGNKVFFGQNLLHNRPGLLKVGMRVEILEKTDG